MNCESWSHFNCIKGCIICLNTANQKFMDQQQQCKWQWLFISLVSALFSQTEERSTLSVSRAPLHREKKNLFRRTLEIHLKHDTTDRVWKQCYARILLLLRLHREGRWWWLRELEIGRRKCVFPLWFITSMILSLSPFMLFFKSTWIFCLTTFSFMLFRPLKELLFSQSHDSRDGEMRKIMQ